MEVEHTLNVIARCPVNGSRDVYETTFCLYRLIKVEEIVEKIAKYQEEPMFQETLTEELAKTFKCGVRTKGIHGAVHTEVFCDRPRKGRGVRRHR
jgi:hypothetical protein